MMDVSMSGPGKWQIALSLIGAVGAVALAYKYNLSGKVWIFLGGGIAGGAVGYLIDSQ